MEVKYGINVIKNLGFTRKKRKGRKKNYIYIYIYILNYIFF